MNERIQELAEQARNYALDEKRIYERVHNTEQCMEEYREVYNKKLAELIVQECMSLCTDVEEDVELADYVGGFRDGALMCREDIKKHFGVEE